MLNQTVIMGRLTGNPDGRLVNGKSMTRFSVAVERDYTDKDGNRGCDFIPVVAWRGTADFVEKYFQRGSMIVVQGRMQSGSYTDNEGVKRYTMELAAESCWFGEPKRKNESSEPEMTHWEDYDGELPY